jgi:hypothetical protein
MQWAVAVCLVVISMEVENIVSDIQMTVSQRGRDWRARHFIHVIVKARSTVGRSTRECYGVS